MEERDVQKKRGWRGSETLWLNAAYDLLIEAGVDGVKVMPLAKRLGLSRASFYWHFEDREALLAALIARWRDKNTGNLVAQTTLYAETITEAMFNLFDCWITPDLFDSQLEFAIRNWAHGAPALQEILEETDRERIAAIEALFLRFGFAADLADAHAHTVYYTQVGYIAMKVVEPLEPRMARMASYVKVLTGKPPSDSEIRRFRSRHKALLASDGV